MTTKTTRPSAATGVKALITATALAATLAGWATLTAQAPATVVISLEPTAISVAAAAPPAWLLSAPEIPTLLPVATAQTAPNLPALAAAAPPVAEVAPPIEPVIASAPVAAPPLREVTAAPAPIARAPRAVTTTRSSR